jgi:hypothetical protein
MQPDRRQVLAAAVSGLGTLLVPGATHACCFRRRRCARAQVMDINVGPFLSCPLGFQWYQTCNSPPSVSKNASYAFTVYGPGLNAWNQIPGNGFYCNVADPKYPGIWSPPTSLSVSPYALGDDDGLTFYSGESGVSPPGATSTVTITVILTSNGNGICPKNWYNSVTYNS